MILNKAIKQLLFFIAICYNLQITTFFCSSCCKDQRVVDTRLREQIVNPNDRISDAASTTAAVHQSNPRDPLDTIIPENSGTNNQLFSRPHTPPTDQSDTQTEPTILHHQINHQRINQVRANIARSSQDTDENIQARIETLAQDPDFARDDTILPHITSDGILEFEDEEIIRRRFDERPETMRTIYLSRNSNSDFPLINSSNQDNIME